MIVLNTSSSTAKIFTALILSLGFLGPSTVYGRPSSEVLSGEVKTQIFRKIKDIGHRGTNKEVIRCALSVARLLEEKDDPKDMPVSQIVFDAYGEKGKVLIGSWIVSEKMVYFVPLEQQPAFFATSIYGFDSDLKRLQVRPEYCEAYYRQGRAFLPPGVDRKDPTAHCSFNYPNRIEVLVSRELFSSQTWTGFCATRAGAKEQDGFGFSELEDREVMRKKCNLFMTALDDSVDGDERQKREQERDDRVLFNLIGEKIGDFSGDLRKSVKETLRSPNNIGKMHQRFQDEKHNSRRILEERSLRTCQSLGLLKPKSLWKIIGH